MNDVMIEAVGLSKYFGTYRALDAITFSVHRGETVGLLGTNGSGKTTTMRILCGYLPQSSGTARIAGFDVLSESIDVRKSVGYLPEEVPLYADMSVSASLRYFGRLHRMGGRQLANRVKEVVDEVGLHEYRDTLIRKLSKGYKQRTGLAHAILHDPEVLILDEPTVSIDPVQLADVRNLIRRLGERHTLLLSTHQLSEAANLCDRVVMINEGMVIADGSVGEIAGAVSTGFIVDVVAQASAEATRSVIQAIENVAHVEQMPWAGVGEVAFAVTGSVDQGLANVIAVALVGTDISVVSITQRRRTLEDAFIELAGPGPNSASEHGPDA